MILKKLSFLFLSLVLCLVTVISYAATNKTSNPQQQSNVKPPSVLLYEQPNNTSKLLAKLSPTVRLIPVYKDKDWLKVGNPKNGQIGWINVTQYRQAQSSYFKPNVQTLFVQVNQDSKDKPSINVVAYKNGQQLDDKQAKIAYNKMQQQQQDQFKQMAQFSKALESLFAQDYIKLHQLSHDPWFGIPVGPRYLQPIIILPEENDQSKHTTHS